jgi:hypothetical protein
VPEIKTEGGVITLPKGPDLEREIADYDMSRFGYVELPGATNSMRVRSYLDSKGVDLERALEAFGVVDIGRETVSRFLTNTGLKPLFSPVVEAGMRMGMELVLKDWQSFIAKSVPINRMSYEYYVFDNVDEEGFRLKQIGQGAPIPTATVTVSGKSYTLIKIGRGIEWSDEAKMAPVALATMWFTELGRRIGLMMFEYVTDMLLNGYFLDGSDAAPTIPLLGANLDYEDIINGYLEMTETYGYSPKKLVCNKKTALKILTWTYPNDFPIFPQVMVDGKYPAPMGIPLIVSSQCADDQVIMVDTDFALMQLVAKPFSTEFDRSVKTQVEGSYGTMTQLVVPLFKNARLIVAPAP